MSEYYERIESCYSYCADKIPFVPKAALILGSGLGEFAKHGDIKGRIAYRDIPGFPVSTVAGHEGQFVFAKIEGVPAVIMQGRVHYYEGYSMEEVVLPVRLMRRMGAKILVLTNASGGINPSFKAGDFMLLTDQISSFVPSPLVGENDGRLGERFPDMSAIYDRDLQRLAKEAAKETNIDLKDGVYIQFTGPAYESPAEIKMAGILGADAVGMSTACEAVAANHMGMRICGISCVVNMAAGIQKTPLSHEEVQAMGKRKSEEFETLMKQFMRKLKEV